ncbi:MAG: hypothetical protein R3267_05635, partial [Paenisporosarcina sp.]|nr:hypothetical protein [Paenisporosarcina sp.]
MKYTQLKSYLLSQLEKEDYFFRQRSLGVLDRAEDTLLSEGLDDIADFAHIIKTNIEQHEQKHLLKELEQR